jgi:sulfhydrogenase subunit gamma (sulfur reductase)
VRGSDMSSQPASPYLPTEAEIVERVEESPGVFTLSLRLTDPQRGTDYAFQPGQFNMLGLHGLGEVPISIVSDPRSPDLIDHTVRVVGRVTRAMSVLQPGDRIGLRGPYGRGWPLQEARGRDVVLITGGLGCAPVVSVIHYVLRRRDDYRRLVILQGVKHSADLIWRDRYQEWAGLADTQVLLAADVGGPEWAWEVGPVTTLLGQAQFDRAAAAVMMCGPEPMMRAAARALEDLGVAEERLWLSMERNMQCALGHCGHCQLGAPFVCREGPVFPYGEIRAYLEHRGF